jgi:ATP-binding cassette subfamily B protein
MAQPKLHGGAAHPGDQLTKREFTPTTEYRYNRTSPVRWILSHILRYPLPPLGMVLAAILANTMASWARVLPGRAFDCVLGMLGLLEGLPFEWFGLEASSQTLLWIALSVMGARIGQGLLGLARNVAVEFLAQHVERDARDELYVSLLGKSRHQRCAPTQPDAQPRRQPDVRLAAGAGGAHRRHRDVAGRIVADTARLRRALCRHAAPLHP